MLFNSLAFLVFFPLATLMYFLVPHPWRWVWLLLVSAYFYMSFVPIYILILITTIVIDFFSGIFIERTNGRARMLFLLLSIFANGGILFFFKYFNFFNENFSTITSFLNITYQPLLLNVVLPIGLSFHVFQSMSYTIEIYRGHQKAERNIGILALYVLFYPQLVAGPIERPQHLIHQFYERHEFEIQRVFRGLALMLGGFLKKIVIADRLSQFVNPVFSNPVEYSGISFAIATLFFAFQIYCDFSGYVDVALGAAEVMGFRLMENFRQPYFSTSITDFWGRWHISLSSWIRDYIYIPLGGNRVSWARWSFNIILAFFLSGLWHGSQWTYVFWGLLHAAYLIIERALLSVIMFLSRFFTIHRFSIIFIEHVWTFTLISIAWILFRANTLHDALYIYSHLGTGWRLLLSRVADTAFINQYIFMEYSGSEFFLAIFSIIVLVSFEFFQRRLEIRLLIARQPVILSSFVYALGILSLLVFGKFSGQEFIYFQF